MDRREFIKKAGRIAALATIAAIGGYSVLKETDESQCNYNFACKNCKSLNSCNLPEAQEYKRDGQER